MSLTDPIKQSKEEESFESNLRPNAFKEVIGRDVEKKSLSIMIESAKMRNRSLDHILFHGPPGLGKTSLSYVVAKEMGASIHITSGAAIGKPGDLAAILTSLEPNSILFIDEIHRLRTTVEEILYPAMEDNVLDIMIGKGPSAKTIRIDLNEFTIIGATTKLSMLSAPLRDRFGMNFRLDFYTEEDLKTIIFQKAKMLGIQIEDKAAEQIAMRARMTPRIAIRILKRVRDLAVVTNKEIIDMQTVTETLDLLKVDELGLNEMDREILKSLIHNFSNKPVGLSTLAASVSEEVDTVEDVYEPFLLKKGLIKRTPRGRQATEKALKLYELILDIN